jgi:hypothetical protein
VVIVFLVFLGIWLWWTKPTPHGPAQVAPGITYECLDVHEPEIEGLAHIVTIDLSTPNLRLYATPLDGAAVQAGWEYKTCWPPSVAASERLTVAINGTLFSTERPKWQIWPGSLSSSSETVIANHEFNHIDPNSYLLWFDDQLVPTLEKQKPPEPDVSRRAKWGISGQGVAVDRSVVSASAGHIRDSRTVLGINREKKLLILGVFDSASQHRAAEMIAQHGASDVILVDGGSSTCLTFGSIPIGLGRRTAVFPYRAVATVFGVGFKPEKLNDEK